MINIIKLGLLSLMLTFVFSQGVFNQYDIPEFEYRTFQVNGNDLFHMTSTGDASTTNMNACADYMFESQSPGNNLNYGLNFCFNMFDEGVDSTGYTNMDLNIPFGAENYFMGATKGAFGFADGDFDMDAGDQAEGVDDTMDLNLTIGAGYGRVVSAKPVAQAYAIADALGNSSDATVLAIAAVIGASGSYASTYKDDADEMYYNDLASAAGDASAAMKIRKILNSPAYNISDRSTGWSVRAGLWNNYMRADGDDDKGDFSFRGDYAMPMGMDKQLTAGFDYGMDMNEDGGTTMGLDVACTMDHSYNWASSASFGYDSETSGGDDAVTSSDIEIELSTTKAILNQLSVTGAFGYKIPNDGVDGTDDDPTTDISVTFTYWVF